MKKSVYFIMMFGLVVMAGCNGKSTNAGNVTNDSTATEEKTVEETVEKTYGVDLGLSVNWAECNVGASEPQEFGLLTSYSNVKGRISAEPIRADISGTKYDIARVKLGEPWRMPTHEELAELISKCTWKHTEVKGVPGLTVTGPNGNSIFLPECGGYDIVDESFGRTLSKTRGFDPCDYRNGTNHKSLYWAGTLELDMFPCLEIENGKEKYARMFNLHGYSAFAVRPVADK